MFRMGADCSTHGLGHHGLHHRNDIFGNLPPPALCDHALRRREGPLSHLGPLVVRTGHQTGRCANDACTVDEVERHDQVWWGTINKPLAEHKFDILHPPRRFAELTGERIHRHAARVRLINTGGTGGAYGGAAATASPHTRVPVNAALDGKRNDLPTWRNRGFGVAVPDSCPGVANAKLPQRDSWADEAAYDARALKLAGMCEEHLAGFRDQVVDAVVGAGPHPRRAARTTMVPEP